VARWVAFIIECNKAFIKKKTNKFIYIGIVIKKFVARNGAFCAANLKNVTQDNQIFKKFVNQ
jgi:hypothetical protein